MKWEDYQNIDTRIKMTEWELTPIECPLCNKFIYRNTRYVLTSNPPKYYYKCECGWTGTGF